jgi:hypothetical protein
MSEFPVCASSAWRIREKRQPVQNKPAAAIVQATLRQLTRGAGPADDTVNRVLFGKQDYAFGNTRKSKASPSNPSTARSKLADWPVQNLPCAR